MMVSIGCVIKNPGNSRNNKTGSWRTFKPILDKEKCIDCDNCILFCPDASFVISTITWVFNYTSYTYHHNHPYPIS